MRLISRLLLLFAFSIAGAAEPTWHAAIAPGTWGRIPVTSLDSSGVEEPGGACIINAWGGGVLNDTGLYLSDTVFHAGNWEVIYGGGHTDCANNEIYALGPLESNSPVWKRLRDSSFVINADTTANGDPVSRHTYNSITYVRTTGAKNWFFTAGGLFRYTDAGATLLTNYFDFDNSLPNKLTGHPWAHKANMPIIAPNSTAAAADVSVWDPKLARVWYHENALGTVSYYDPATNTHTGGGFKSPLGYGGNAMSALDTARGIWAIWDYNYGISFYRTNSGVSNDYYHPSLTGYIPHCALVTGTCDSTNFGTILYDPQNDYFVLRTHRDSSNAALGDTKSYFTLKAPATSPYQGGNAWTFAKVTPAAGVTPHTGDPNGTFGRFQMINKPGIQGYLYVGDAAQSVWFFNTSTAKTWGPFGDNDIFLLKAGF